MRIANSEVNSANNKEAHMTSKTPNQKRKTVRLNDQKVIRGEGGEAHQNAGADVSQLTTQQGIPVSDDQNTLKGFARSRRPGRLSLS